MPWRSHPIERNEAVGGGHDGREVEVMDGDGWGQRGAEWRWQRACKSSTASESSEGNNADI